MAAVASCPEDLAMSDDSFVVDHWPVLPDSTPSSPSSVQLGSMLSTSSSPTMQPVMDSSRPSLPPHGSTSTMASPPSFTPGFAPRATYAKLSFTGSPSTDTKLRWLSTVTKTFRLQRDQTDVKMAAVTSRFIYISRQRTDILERVQSGEFLSLPLALHESPERPRKYPSYILTRYPVDVDPGLATSYPGVHSARRFIQDGSPINRIVIVWSLPAPPPPVISFDFLPCLPPCSVQRLLNDQPWCYRCWGVGHISRYCSASPRCGWCAADHDSRTCPARSDPTLLAASSSASQPPPPEVPSLLKCPRCLQPGVPVWHGCTRRQAPARASPAALPPPPPSSASRSGPAFVSASPVVANSSWTVVDLETQLNALGTRLTTLETRFTTLETALNKLAGALSTVESKVSSLAASEQAILSAIAALSTKLDALAPNSETLREPSPPSGPSPAASALPRPSAVPASDPAVSKLEAATAALRARTSEFCAHVDAVFNVPSTPGLSSSPSPASTRRSRSSRRTGPT